MDRCQRADYSIERRGYERDEPRFELIFRKSKTRSSTPSSYVYPVIPAGHCFRFDSTDEGGGAIEKAVRTSMAAARDSGSTRGNPRIDRQRRAAVDKQPRIPTYPALYPKLKFDFPHWIFPLPLLLEQAILPWAWDEDRNVSDFQGEDLRYSLSFSKIKCEFVLIGSKLVSNRCVILSISSFRVLISKNIVLTCSAI